MRITVQQGIDVSTLKDAIFKTIQAGMECDAHATRLLWQERKKLMGKQLQRYVPASAQGDLFEEEV